MANINGLTGTAADVNASNELKVAPTQTIGNAGFVALASENDAGVATGTRVLFPPETSDDYRLRVGVDCIVDQEFFCYANQNTGKYNYTSTTLTFSLASAALTSNGSGITTINTAARFFTQRGFGLNAQQTSLYVETNASFAASLSGSTNTTIDFGLFLDSAASPYAPSDGVYWRATNAGISGVINFNGVETPVGPFELVDGAGVFIPTIGQQYQFLISANNREVKFWIDDVLVGEIATQAGNPGPFQSQTLPYKVRHAIGGTAAGNVQQFKIGSYSIYWGDVERDKPWGHVCSAMGGGMQVQPGASTGGQLTTYALGAAPGAVTLTANTAPATNTLGGLALLPAAITAGESDYPLFAWQNPAGTVAIPGRVFHCTAIRVGDAVIYPTALVGGPLIIQWAVGWGSTAASLATTESTTFSSGTTKIARKHPLGAQVFAAAAAIGTLAAGFQVDFTDAPLAINPGEFLHIIIRCQGTNTTAGTPRVQVTPIGYFE